MYANANLHIQICIYIHIYIYIHIDMCMCVRACVKETCIYTKESFEDVKGIMQCVRVYIYTCNECVYMCATFTRDLHMHKRDLHTCKRPTNMKETYKHERDQQIVKRPLKTSEGSCNVYMTAL